MGKVKLVSYSQRSAESLGSIHTAGCLLSEAPVDCFSETSEMQTGVCSEERLQFNVRQDDAAANSRDPAETL